MAPSSTHTPVATPLPEPPSADWMADEQWETLWRVAEALLPSITSESAATDPARQIILSDHELDNAIESASSALASPPNPDEIRQYLAQHVSDSPAFRRDVQLVLTISPQRDKLANALKFLRTRLGSLFLTWYWNPLDQQPVHVREIILKSWKNGNMQGMKLLLRTLSAMAQRANAVTNPLFHQLSGYSETPKDWRPVKGHEFDFVQVPPGDGPHVIDTDVVVVGSGPGGGVTAKNLAEAGLKVLVVDKGYHFPPSQLPMTQASGTQYLFDNNGSYMSEDGALATINASTWGGGGTVNWSVCLNPPDNVRQEWADAGLPFFTTDEFDACLDRVNSLVGAGTSGIRHNRSNQVILEGCKKLGWKSYAAPQNTAGKEHYCGQCHLGCGLGEKRGPVVSMLPPAAEAGANFMEGFEVDKVVFASDGKTAIGVEGLWTSRGPDNEVHTPSSQRMQRLVKVNARRVVISAGSLWSPLLLKRSGIQNPQVGKNLHLHPCNLLTASFRQETRPWEGGIITAYSDEYGNLDSKGHGSRFEPVCMVPYTVYAQQTWHSGLDAKLWHLRYRHITSYISLTRDRDSGEVFPDPETGKPRINYVISEFDREHTLDGLQGLAKLCYVSGATEIRTNMMGLEPFVSTQRDDDSDPLLDGQRAKDPEFVDPKFAAWLLRMRQVGNAPPLASYSSAHQMGSCRMSATEDGGVVDKTGKVWGAEGLYVADSSILPSASGVNPMISTLAVSDWVSRGLARDLMR